MKVSELTGAKLNFWAGKADSRNITLFKKPSFVGDNCYIKVEGERGFYSPSTDRSQGGPIIERESIEFMSGISPRVVSAWSRDKAKPSFGDTYLIAAMRCFSLW